MVLPVQYRTVQDSMESEESCRYFFSSQQDSAVSHTHTTKMIRDGLVDGGLVDGDWWMGIGGLVIGSAPPPPKSIVTES